MDNRALARASAAAAEAVIAVLEVDGTAAKDGAAVAAAVGGAGTGRGMLLAVGVAPPVPADEGPEPTLPGGRGGRPAMLPEAPAPALAAIGVPVPS